MSERAELLDVEVAVECKPLWARRENLLCNAGEWQESNPDET